MSNMNAPSTPEFDFAKDDLPTDILGRARAIARRIAESRTPPHVSINDVRDLMGRSEASRLNLDRSADSVFAGPEWVWTGQTIESTTMCGIVRVWRLNQ